MNDDKQMKRAISKIIGKAYTSCVKAERKAAKAILKLAGQRTKEWNKDNVTFVRGFNKMKRNELCPCESGLKYKKCCELVMHNKVQSVYEDIHRRQDIAKQLKKSVKELKDGNSNTDSSDRPRLILSTHLEDKEREITLPNKYRTSTDPKYIVD